MNDAACIDLFCGAGGLTFGLRRKGLNVVVGIDVDEGCRHPYENNNKSRFVQANVSNVPGEALDEAFGKTKVKILAGCAPCQPFSTYSQRYDTEDDPRWFLLKAFARLVKESKPHIVTMENVPAIARHKVFREFSGFLGDLGYKCEHEIVDCAQNGLPQKRKRLVLLASKLGTPDIATKKRAKQRTVRDAIARLPSISPGIAHDTDRLHVASRLSELNARRIKESRPGGTWREWPDELVAECHRKDSGKSYPDVYGRMEWDRPSPTLTTQFYGFGNGRFGHPEEDRAISLREGAILQGFPKSYSFLPASQPVRLKALGRMIGNAVPVPLGEIIGESIAKHLEN